MSLEIHSRDISGLPIAPLVNKQFELKRKTRNEQHTRTETTLAS